MTWGILQGLDWRSVIYELKVDTFRRIFDSKVDTLNEPPIGHTWKKKEIPGWPLKSTKSLPMNRSKSFYRNTLTKGSNENMLNKSSASKKPCSSGSFSLTEAILRHSPSSINGRARQNV